MCSTCITSGSRDLWEHKQITSIEKEDIRRKEKEIYQKTLLIVQIRVTQVNKFTAKDLNLTKIVS